MISIHDSIYVLTLQIKLETIIMNKTSEEELQNKHYDQSESIMAQSIVGEDQETIITDNYPLYAKRIMLAFRKIMHKIDQHSRQLNKHYGLTVPQLICLYDIYEKGIVTLSVLAKNVHLTRSTLVGIVDRLEEKGFVKRTRDIEDRRTIFIDITDQGKDFVYSAPHLIHNILHEELKLLPESDRVIIANSLDLLVDLLKIR